jgi:hypothetical protein
MSSCTSREEGVLFEDPDGIRLEMNHVPGQGLLAEGVSMNPGEYR